MMRSHRSLAAVVILSTAAVLFGTLAVGCSVDSGSDADGDGNGNGEKKGDPSDSNAPDGSTSPPGSQLPAPYAPIAVGAAITPIAFVNNLSSAQAGRYVTFGKAFAPGEITGSVGVALQVDGTNYPVQLDQKVSNADGSLRFAVLTAQLPDLAASQTASGNLLVAAAPPPGPALTAQKVLDDASYDVVVTMTVGGQTKTASARQALQAAVTAGKIPTHLSGPLVSEFNVRQALTTSLHAEFDIRVLPNGDIRTEVSVTNDFGFVNGIGSFTYDLTVKQAGQNAMTLTGFKHAPFTNWHKAFWHGKGVDVFVKHDRAYWAKSRAVPNYDPAAVPTAAYLNEMSSAAAGAKCGPGGTGTMLPYMPNTGLRDDIGFLPAWDAVYFMSMDKRAQDLVLCNADAAASIPYHVAEQPTGLPYSLADRPTLWLDSRGASNADRLVSYDFGGTPWTTDTAHMPSVGYSAYLITGNRVYLQESQFQAQAALGLEWNVPRGNGSGWAINTEDQVRAQGWTLRSIANAAHVTPDGHPMKAYFDKILDNNLQNALDVYVNGKAGTSQGEIFGYINGANRDAQLPPWQQGYIGVVFGQIANRGHAKAVSVLTWQSNFILGLYNQAPSVFCPISNAYQYDILDSNDKPHQTWSAFGAANFSGACPTSLDTAGGEYVMYQVGAMGPMVDNNLANATKVRDFITQHDPLWNKSVPSGDYFYPQRSGSLAGWAIAPLK